MKRVIIQFFEEKNNETLSDAWIKKEQRSLKKSPHLILLLSNLAMYLDININQRLIYKQQEESKYYSLLINTLVLCSTITHAIAKEWSLRVQKAPLTLNILIKIPGGLEFLSQLSIPKIFIKMLLYLLNI